MGIFVKGVSKSFGAPPTFALSNITLEIAEGAFISITGRSGSGKSTLLYILSTLDRATSGTVEIDGVNTVGLGSQQLHAFRNNKMGFVFQFHHLFPECTALENVLFPARKTNEHEKRKELGLQLLRDFDIGEKAHRFPNQLSGGEQQRVAIARALIMEPKYLFADEPTGNLDSTNGMLVMKHFARVNRESKTTIVYVTHDREFATLANQKIVLVDGQLGTSTNE